MRCGARDVLNMALESGLLEKKSSWDGWVECSLLFIFSSSDCFSKPSCNSILDFSIWTYSSGFVPASLNSFISSLFWWVVCFLNLVLFSRLSKFLPGMLLGFACCCLGFFGLWKLVTLASWIYSFLVRFRSLTIAFILSVSAGSLLVLAWLWLCTGELLQLVSLISWNGLLLQPDSSLLLAGESISDETIVCWSTAPWDGCPTCCD